MKKKIIKNKSNLKGTNEIKDYENNILSSPKNINLFNKLIQLFIDNFENKNENKNNEIIESFKNILNYYLMDKNIKSSKEIISFFENKIELIFKIILDIISNNNDKFDMAILFMIFNTFYELINFVSDNKIKFLFEQLLEKLIFNNIGLSQEIIISFYEKFNSIFYYEQIFDCLLSIIKNKKIKNEKEFHNFYIFIINIKDLDNFLEIEDNKSEEEEKNKNNEEEINKLKEKYQNIITNILNEKLLPLSIVKEFMKILNKKIIQNVTNPIIFSDYLIKKTSEIEIKSINDFDIQIFGLSSLFVLLTKYNLDYDKYYELLYKLISQKFNFITIFDSKYKNRILKLLQLSLTLEQIPYIVICSFIKKLLRISLFSKVEIIYSLLSLVMKIIQLQPRTLNLIMNNKSKKILKKDIENNSIFLNAGDGGNTDNLEEIKNCISLDEDKDIKIDNDKGYDNFDEKSIDPFNTNAENCSLWELYSFTRHYNMGIRKLVNRFSRNFLAKEIEMEIKSQKDSYFDIKNLNSHFYINK